MRCLLVDDDLTTLNVIRDFVNWKLYGINAVDTACNISQAKMLIG